MYNGNTDLFENSITDQTITQFPRKEICAGKEKKQVFSNKRHAIQKWAHCKKTAEQ